MIRWSVATVFFLAVMALAGYYVFNRAVAAGPMVTVPDLENLTYDESAALVTEANLVLAPPKSVFNDQWPENRVMHQVPSAGKVVRAGRRVHMTLSRGPDAQAAPDVTGQSLQMATMAIEQANLNLGSMARIADRRPADTVIAQDPPAGLGVGRGGEVHLLLSAGRRGEIQQAYLMPDLVGLTLQQAQGKLGPMGVIGVRKDVTLPGKPIGVVVEQSLPNGSSVKQGQQVTLHVNTEQKKVVWSNATVSYTIPHAWFSRSVRIDIVGSDGSRHTEFPRREHYVNGEPPRYEPGTTIRQDVRFQNEITVEIFLDGQKVRSIYYQAESQPIVTDYEVRQQGN